MPMLRSSMGTWVMSLSLTTTLPETGSIKPVMVPPDVFEVLQNTKPGKGGEIQLTDALKVMAKRENVYAYNFTGKRYDVGDKLGFLKATVEFALRRDDLSGDFAEYLKTIVKDL